MRATFIGNGRISTVLATALVAIAAMLVFAVSPAFAVGSTPEDTWRTSGTVFDTVLSPDGKTLYLGGKFASVREKPAGQGGEVVSVKNLAAIDVATGTVVRNWRPQVTGGTAASVRSLAVKNGKVYVGGNFTAVNGATRNNIAAVDAVSGAVDTRFTPSVTFTTSTVPYVFTLLPGDSQIYVGGEFNSVNGRARGKLAALDLTTGALDVAWDPKASRMVRDIQFSSDKESIFVVGRFATMTGADGASAPRKNVARLVTSTGNLHPWSVPAGVIGEDLQTSWEALVTPTRLYAGFGDKGANYVASFRLDNGDVGDQVWRYGTVGDVYSLALSPDNKRLFFGGHFGLVRLEQQVCGGKYLRGLGSLNPNNGQLYCDWLPQIEPFRENGNGPWNMDITDGSRLWVGGGFTGISGVPQSNIARFDLNAKSANYAVPKVDLNGFQKNSGQQRGGLNATYYDNIDFTGTEVPRIDAGVNFDFGGGSPDGAIGSDTFSARWTGQVEAPVSGDYTFTTTSDDGVRLSVDGRSLVDNWTNHGPTDDSGTITLQAGQKYDVSMEFFEDGGGAMLRLAWEYPGQARQIVPAGNLFYSADNVGGLDVTFFDNMDFTGAQVSRVEPTINSDFGNGSPDPAIGVDTFSARWSGQVEAPVSGQYTFTTTGDDGVRLFVDGKSVVENWSDRAPADDSGTVTLEAGKRYDIQFDYYENGGGAVARLAWEYPGQARQIVPARNLLFSGGTGYAADFAAGGGPVSIVDSANLAVTDADDANLKSVTVTLGNSPDGAAEILSANTTGTSIVAGYDARTGMLSLSGPAPKAAFQQVLRTVRVRQHRRQPHGWQPHGGLRGQRRLRQLRSRHLSGERPIAMSPRNKQQETTTVPGMRYPGTASFVRTRAFDRKA